MPRLPQPGGDNGNWGDILNDYLSQAHAVNGLLKDGSVTRQQLTTGVQTELDSYLTQTEVDARITASASGVKIVGVAETFVNYAQAGTSNQLVMQVMFTATSSLHRVKVVGGSVTAVNAVVTDWTLVEGVSGAVIRHVTRSLAANTADPVPAIERVWNPTAGVNTVRLFLKLTTSVSTTITANPSGEESPLQLIVEELGV